MDSWHKRKSYRNDKERSSKAEIANAFGMSESSVTLLKYSSVKSSLERVKCEICGKILKQITVKHLNNHNISLEEYKIRYPNSQTITEYRSKTYKNFKHPNKGKTYEEIYGEEDASIKRQKISEKQIGREAAERVGTGITGTRKDTMMFARSTYEANVDRIFAFENKKISGEFSEQNERFSLVKKDGTKITYHPDRIDLEGLFLVGAYLEIKGYMYPEDWEKICLFREQHQDKKLLVISRDKEYCDINYSELEDKYKKQIPLWECEYQNYRKNPSIYKTNYIEPEVEKFYRENYTDMIANSIIDEHIKFIAKKCVSYCSVRLGKKIYVDSVNLISISDKRPKSKASSGEYNYELWEINTDKKERYYVTNQNKRVLFYCYENSELDQLKEFFNDNSNMSLKYGAQNEKKLCHIEESLIKDFERRDILNRLEAIFVQRGIHDKINKIELIYKEDTKRGAINDREEWKIEVSDGEKEYKLSNIRNPTTEYNLIATKV